MVMVKNELKLPPDIPPRCRCDSLLRLTTRTSNRNGNAGRPYLKCSDCRMFVTFTDARGDHAVNRMCHCQRPSRLQVSSLQKGRKLHYVCSTGQCDFYRLAINKESKLVILPEDLVEDLADLKLI